MSWNPTIEPQCPDAGDVDSIETLIVPRSRDLGGFSVRRALPSPKRQMVWRLSLIYTKVSSNIVIHWARTR
ncbi:MAG: hypothetical protein AB8B63_09365 [Granulosicoccus sp.]